MLVTIVKDLLIDPSLLRVFVLVEDVVGCPRDAFLGVVTWTGRLGRKGSGSGVFETSIGEDTCPYCLGTSRRPISARLPP